MYRRRSRREAMLIVEIVLGERRRILEADCTAFGYRQAGLIARLDLFGGPGATTYAALDKLRPCGLQRTPDFIHGAWRDLAQPARSLQSADRHNGYIRASGQFVLLQSQQGTGGADLVRRDQHDHFIS